MTGQFDDLSDGSNRTLKGKPENESMVQKRTLVCSNCGHEWTSTKHPNSYNECPKCKMKNNNIRRIISWKDKGNSARKQFE